MKSLMTNSTHPDIFAAKMRDQLYLKHLRQVERINNREASVLKQQLKQYNQIYESHQKMKRKAKQFDSCQHNTQILKKNDLITTKIKNIRSLFNFNNLHKSSKRSDSLSIENDNSLQKIAPLTGRYNRQNQETKQMNQISQQISQNISNSPKTLKEEESKRNKLSLNYFLRKRQQQLIEYENQKLKKGILSQKSAYSSPSKRTDRSLKLPSLNTARYNFNQKNPHQQNSKAKETNETRQNDSVNAK